MRKPSDYGPSLIVLATAMVVLFAGPSAVKSLTYEQTRTQIVQARRSLNENSVLAEFNQAYRNIAALVEPSVVHISAQSDTRDPWGRPAPGISSGSGWIYDDLGHVVTNHHVVEDADRIQVQLHDGELREAHLIGSDQFTDIAVLKISPGRLHSAVRAPADGSVRQGDLVFAFGSPFDFRFSMSSGVVSGKGRSVGVIRDQFGRRSGYENFIQVDAAINPGNSGGPLTDYLGQVIGMNTAIATRRQNGNDEGQFAGIGLAIPIEMIEPVVTQLIETGVVAKGYLGVTAEDIASAFSLELRKRGFIGTGVFVTGVPADGPALQAGIRVDDIITHVNDEQIRSMSGLRSVISSILPGELVSLRIWRHDETRNTGEQHEFVIELDRLDTLVAAGVLPADQNREGIPELGIGRMATCTPALAAELGLEHREGVVIEQVVAGSSLAAAEIMPGAIIVAVMDRPVATTEQFINALREHDLRSKGARVTVVTHDGRYRLVVLRVG